MCGVHVQCVYIIMRPWECVVCSVQCVYIIMRPWECVVCSVQCVYIIMRRFFEHVSASSPLTGTFDLTHPVLGLEVVDYDGA